MAASQYLHIPGYSVLLLRRSFTDLMQPDAMIPRSQAWWTGKASWNQQQRRWTFPSGATVTFGYLESDAHVHQYQGAAYQFIGFDELTQHTEYRYRYLFSRLRRPAHGPLSQVPLRMRAGSNPGGPGHDWVKKRFLKETASDRVFVPARLSDNPHLDAQDYLASLSALDPITRKQLEEGNWDDIEGGRFRKEWFRRWKWANATRDALLLEGQTKAIPLSACTRFATVDPAASTKVSADYTAISVWADTPNHELAWLDCRRGRWEIPDITPEIQSLYDKWDLSFVGIEGGGAQKGVYQLARRTRMAVRELLPGPVDKLIRATKAIVLASDGRVYLPEHGSWIDDALAELTLFTGNEKEDAHDDMVDTLSYAADIVASRQAQKQRGFAPVILGGKV